MFGDHLIELRKPFLLESGLTGGLERAAAEVLSGGARTREGAVELDDELGGGAAGHAFLRGGHEGAYGGA